jgi:hypothetical protein
MSNLRVKETGPLVNIITGDRRPLLLALILDARAGEIFPDMRLFTGNGGADKDKVVKAGDSNSKSVNIAAILLFLIILTYRGEFNVNLGIAQNQLFRFFVKACRIER